MKLTIEPTPQIVDVDGAPCRRWVGRDDQDVPVEVLVRCLSPVTDDVAVEKRYTRELKELGPPMFSIVWFVRLIFGGPGDGR